MRQIDEQEIVGKTFTRLTVLNFDTFKRCGRSKYSQPFYQCLCSCGKKEFTKLIEQPCYYCGQPPDTVRKANSTSSNFILANGIDRIDSQLGYTCDNVVSCCPRCNRIKGNLNQTYFILHIIKICQHLQH